MNQVEIKVTIDVTDQQQVEALNALFATLAGGQPLKTVSSKTAKPKTEKPKADSAPESETQKKEETKTEDPGIKIEDVRALLAKKVENNRAEIKTKLTALDAPNVTALDKSKYPEFVEFLNSLK